MSTVLAKPPRPLRLNQRAELVPAAQHARWYGLAIQTPGLTKAEFTVLSAVATYYRLLDQRGYASSPTIEDMALSIGARPIDITSAIEHLISPCLVAVRPGSGRWPNQYLPALPKRMAASLAPAAVEDGPPF